MRRRRLEFELYGQLEQLIGRELVELEQLVGLEQLLELQQLVELVELIELIELIELQLVELEQFLVQFFELLGRCERRICRGRLRTSVDLQHRFFAG